MSPFICKQCLIVVSGLLSSPSNICCYLQLTSLSSLYNICCYLQLTLLSSPYNICCYLQLTCCHLHIMSVFIFSRRLLWSPNKFSFHYKLAPVLVSKLFLLSLQVISVILLKLFAFFSVLYPNNSGWLLLSLCKFCWHLKLISAIISKMFCIHP